MVKKMKVYLISNNSLVENINYNSSDNLELIRMIRSLSVTGEEVAKKISNLDIFKNITKIYSSFYSSALSTAKYLQEKLDLEIIMNMNLNDCNVGILGNKNMKMVKGIQDHDFNYKLSNGESLNDVGRRLNNFISSLDDDEVVLFTHKRAILGYLLLYSKVDYNLDDNLILEYNNEVIYDDSDTDYDIYELDITNQNVIIKKINL